MRVGGTPRETGHQSRDLMSEQARRVIIWGSDPRGLKGGARTEERKNKESGEGV